MIGIDFYIPNHRPIFQFALAQYFDIIAPKIDPILRQSYFSHWVYTLRRLLSFWIMRMEKYWA